RWLRGQLLLGLVVGMATFGGLLLLGVLVDARFIRFAVLLAVVAGIFELLPIVGPILSMIPTLLVAATISPAAIAAVVVLYLVVQQLENNVLVPKIQGDAVELHPSIVILALVVGGAIAGLLGAIFALPVAAAARDIYRYLYRRLGDAEEGGAAETVAADLGVAAAPPTTLREGPGAPVPPAPEARPVLASPPAVTPPPGAPADEG
ncbi:MAG TPA: AI-2E family transporter, partial [Candidatus Limnocylindrales bacterium]|nr:AI-2E family transporter [Candidatus Limnocylindrales bacterium]